MKIVTRRSRAKSDGKSNILCLTIDRLNPDCLGAYGATWLDSPGFNSLAAESIVFDSYYATSLELNELYRAFWFGESPATERREKRSSLFAALKAQGYRNFVVSDVEAIALYQDVDGDELEDRLLFDASDADAPATSIEETAFFRQFAELARFLSKLDDDTKRGDAEPWCVWAHLSGWNERWDFPCDQRRLFQEDEDDPAPYADVAPPYWRREPTAAAKAKRRGARVESTTTHENANVVRSSERARLDALDEADRRQSVVEAYAAGVNVFDETLAGFLELLKERKILDKTMLVLSGARGCPLGAPSALGVPGENDEPSPFYSEETRIPLAIRLPDMTCATMRLPALCEPRDVYETIRSWPEFAPALKSEEFWRLENVEISPFAGVWSGDKQTEDESPKSTDDESTSRRVAPPQDEPGANLLELLADETGSVREAVFVVARDAKSQERALVNQDWFFKRTPTPNDSELSEPTEKLELFKLPDDRYCVNDVADRCQDEVERLNAAL